MNIDLSVFKRRTGSAEEVAKRLTNQGFEETDTVLGGRLIYLENDEGINLTVANGPAGALVFPSGPIRGSLFGDSSVGFGKKRDSPPEQVNEDNTGDRGSQATTRFNV